MSLQVFEGLLVGQAVHEVAVPEDHLHNAPTHQQCQQVLCRCRRSAHRAHDLSEPDEFAVAPAAEEPPDVAVVFEGRSIGTEAVVPASGQDRVGPDVFILQSQVGIPLAFFILAAMRTVPGRLHHHLEHTAHIRLPDLAPEFYGRLAIQLGRSLHHVQFLVHADPAHRAVVLDSDEESPSVGVRKGNQRPRNLAAVVDAGFEVLLLVLPFRDHSKDVRHATKMAWSNGRCRRESTGF